MTDTGPKVYRKNRAVGIILRVACIVIAILVLLAVLLFFGLRRYIAYSDTGRLYLDIPWLAEYMEGEPQDDPLSSELTLTGDSYKTDRIPPSSPPQESSALPDSTGEEPSTHSVESSQEAVTDPSPDTVPEG